MTKRSPVANRLVVSVRVLDARGDRVFGEGIATLLGEIERTGSIAEAAREMGMAYSKAWRIIRNLEKALGKPALIRKKGGRAKGGAVLTPAGRMLLKRYQALLADLRRSLDAPQGRRILALFG